MPTWGGGGPEWSSGHTRPRVESGVLPMTLGFVLLQPDHRGFINHSVHFSRGERVGEQEVRGRGDCPGKFSRARAPLLLLCTLNRRL